MAQWGDPRHEKGAVAQHVEKVECRRDGVIFSGGPSSMGPPLRTSAGVTGTAFLSQPPPPSRQGPPSARVAVHLAGHAAHPQPHGSFPRPPPTVAYGSGWQAAQWEGRPGRSVNPVVRSAAVLPALSLIAELPIRARQKRREEKIGRQFGEELDAASKRNAP